MWNPPILGIILSNIIDPSSSILNMGSNIFVKIPWSISRIIFLKFNSVIASSDRLITAKITFISEGGAVIGGKYPTEIFHERTI